MLTTALVRNLLKRLPSLHVGVVGDLFLDRYLDLDSARTEPSVETGLDAYQVVGVREYPGAAGTVLNNLAAMKVGRVSILSVIGDDGDGFVLRRALDRLGIDQQLLLHDAERFTPTYTKPMLHTRGQPPRELNRLDIKNRKPLPRRLEREVLERLPTLMVKVDALVVLDQVSELDCGVVTTSVRKQLGRLAAKRPGLFVLADSRERIGLFRHVAVKPNERECRRAAPGVKSLATTMQALARHVDGPVFCTCGAAGILLAEPGRHGLIRTAPAFPTKPPIDTVGAGDSTSAGIACAMAAGATLAEAAAFGNLVASITIQQIGVTGAATPALVRARWGEVKPQERSTPESER